MKKTVFLIVVLVLFAFVRNANACTNFLITKGASTDGSCMISYAADSHVLYGELYHYPAADYAPGTMLDVWDWDGGMYRGQIPQVLHTYNVVGNMNEYQVRLRAGISMVMESRDAPGETALQNDSMNEMSQTLMSWPTPKEMPYIWAMVSAVTARWTATPLELRGIPNMPSLTM